MANEHLVCEFCNAEFDALEAYQQHKAERHARAEDAQQRIMDEESAQSFPASDTPAGTNPTMRTGEACNHDVPSGGDSARA